MTTATNSFPRTHCGRGHELIPDNVYIRPDGKRRQCRICKLEANRAWRQGRHVTTPFTHCRRGHLLNLETTYALSNGRRSCAICQKERLKRQYQENGWRFIRHGITEKEYQGLREQQGYCCPICQQELQSNKEVIDHNHETGQVRGILCTNCNTALGKLGDSTDLLMRAMRYLDNDCNNP